MNPTPTPEPPPGYELLPPDFLRKHGAQEGMMNKGTNSEGCQWVLSARIIVPWQTLHEAGCIFCAPTGTIAAAEGPKHPKIVTAFIYPPIPIRSFDWIAYYDGQEEEGPTGHGKTEQEAKDDLVEQDESRPSIFDNWTPQVDSYGNPVAGG